MEPEAAAAAAAAQDKAALGPAAAMKKGPWTAAEDAVLAEYVQRHGERNWSAVQRTTGLARCGKSCRLRWTNHLRPDLKKGSFSPDEELLVARLHAQLGNKWSRMAAEMPGRTDNEIKNYWNTRLKRLQRKGLPVYPPEVRLQLGLASSSRHGFASSAPPSPSMAPPLDAAAARSYTSARPPPLDLAGQFAVARAVPFLEAFPLSAPTSPAQLPWPGLLAGSPLGFQFPYSSPVSPTSPAMLAVAPDLSLGYGMRCSLPPLSPSTAVINMELPSIQLRPPVINMEQSNAARLEAMLQEVDYAVQTTSAVWPGTTADVRGGGTDGSSAAAPRGSAREPDTGIGKEMENEPKDETGTLFDLISTPSIPSLSGLSDPDHDDTSGDSGEAQLLAGVIGSPEEEWSLDSYQWSNMSGIY